MSESKWKKSSNSVISGIPILKTRSISSSAESFSRAISPLKQSSKSKIPIFARARSLPNIVKPVNHQKRSLSLNDHIDVSDDLLTLSAPLRLHTDENNWLVTSESANGNDACKEISDGEPKSNANENINETDNTAFDCKYNLLCMPLMQQIF